MMLRINRNIDVIIYGDMSDEDLIYLYEEGDSYALEHLINRYKNYVISKARTYFLIGGDKDDIIQEGMIGLYKAIKDYDENRLASFKYFADICIRRQIITAIKTATRQKHMPLNSYISLNRPIYIEETERTLLDIIEGSQAVDPVKEFIIQENMEYIRSRTCDILSELETEVLDAYMNGKTYDEIAEELTRDKKSIDNALQRIKRKLVNSFENFFLNLY